MWHVLSPFCPRRQLLRYVVAKSRTLLSCLSEDFLEAHLLPFLAPELSSGAWLSEAAEGHKVRLMVAGCGTQKVTWSVPLLLDGAAWRFAVRMRPLGVLCIEQLVEYDAAAAMLRRRSSSGGWGAPELQPPVSRKARREASRVLVDLDTLSWRFRIGLDDWLSDWIPCSFAREQFHSLKLSVVLLGYGAECSFLSRQLTADSGS